MRNTTRTLVALAATTTLVAGGVAPATAKSSFAVRESGSFASIDITGPESSEQIPGNYLVGSLDLFSGMAFGYASALDCPAGADPLGGDECTYVGEVGLDGLVTMSTGKGKTSTTTFAGDLFAYTFSFDPDTDEGNFEELGTLTLDAVLTPYGKSMTMRGSDSFKDPNTGYSYSARWSQTARYATVDGSLGGLALDGDGLVGTYKHMQTERQR